jgi:murein L,D-transpeptidase YafK
LQSNAVDFVHFGFVVRGFFSVRVKILLVVLLVIGAAEIFLFVHYRRNPLPANTTIDRIVVEKSARTLSIFRVGKKLKTYRVALGRNPIGPKEEEGDMKTPEGVYRIDNRKADSDYNVALHISYPSAEDNTRAAARNVSAGCDIEIHGLPNGHSWADFHPTQDWTAGCIAVTDEEIEELWRVTPDGTPIEIRP